MDRSCRVGVHGRNDTEFYEADYNVIRDAKIEVLKMMSHTRVEHFKNLQKQNQGLEFITRLYDEGNFGVHGHPHPEDFARRMIPVMNNLRPYCTKFEIHNEPNHLDRIEGWGQTDEHARDFNTWFLRIYDIFKHYCPWARFGFPGLAIPHRDLEWIDICRPAIEKADWLGVHCYWQTPRGQERNHLHSNWGLRFKHYHERYPNKIIELTEVGNSNVQNNIPFTEESHAQEFTEYLTECFKYRYLNSASFFILSSADPSWDGFTWRSENWRPHKVVEAVGKLTRPNLVPARASAPTLFPAASPVSPGVQPAPTVSTPTVAPPPPLQLGTTSPIGTTVTAAPMPAPAPAPMPASTPAPAPAPAPIASTSPGMTQLQSQNTQLQSQLQQLLSQSAQLQSQLEQLRSENTQLLNQIQQIQTQPTGITPTVGVTPPATSVTPAPPPSVSITPPSSPLPSTSPGWGTISAQPTSPAGAFAPPSSTAPLIQDISQQLKHHPTLRYGSRPTSQIDRIISHHTAIPPSVGAERIAEHRVDNQGWPGIGYHYFITGDGQIQQTNALTTVSNHANDQYNPVSIGVCFAGNFMKDVPFPAQIEAGAQLIAWLIQQLNLSPQAVYGYKELIKTQSPGDQWDGGARWGNQLRRRVQDYLAGVG